jgi:hypothetical protein
LTDVVKGAMVCLELLLQAMNHQMQTSFPTTSNLDVSPLVRPSRLLLYLRPAPISTQGFALAVPVVFSLPDFIYYFISICLGLSRSKSSCTRSIRYRVEAFLGCIDSRLLSFLHGSSVSFCTIQHPRLCKLHCYVAGFTDSPI